MRFSLIATALAFAFSANAAALDKRTVATCVTSLAAISTQLTTVTNGVSAYTASQGYLGALTVQAQESTLETRVTSAYSSSNCCIGSVVSDADAATIIAQVSPLTTQIVAALAAIVSKKSVFDSVALVTPLVKGDINSLNTKTNTLSACLLASTPSDLTATAQGYVDQINTAFASAVAAYA